MASPTIYKRFTLKDGSVYIGECLHDEATGTGVLRVPERQPLNSAAEFRGQVVKGQPHGWGVYIYPGSEQYTLSGRFVNGNHCIDNVSQEEDDRAWQYQRVAILNMFKAEIHEHVPQHHCESIEAYDFLFQMDDTERNESLSYAAQCITIARSPIQDLDTSLDESRIQGHVSDSLSMTHGSLIHPDFGYAYTVLMQEPLSISCNDRSSDRLYIVFNSPSLDNIQTEDELRFLLDDITNELSPQHVASLLLTGHEVWIMGHSLGGSIAYMYAMEVIWRILRWPLSNTCLAQLTLLTFGQVLLPKLYPDLEAMFSNSPRSQSVTLSTTSEKTMYQQHQILSQAPGKACSQQHAPDLHHLSLASGHKSESEYEEEDQEKGEEEEEDDDDEEDDDEEQKEEEDSDNDTTVAGSARDGSYDQDDKELENWNTSDFRSESEAHLSRKKVQNGSFRDRSGYGVIIERLSETRLSLTREKTLSQRGHFRPRLYCHSVGERISTGDFSDRNSSPNSADNHVHGKFCDSSGQKTGNYLSSFEEAAGRSNIDATCETFDPEKSNTFKRMPSFQANAAAFHAWQRHRAILTFTRGDIFPYVYGLAGSVGELSRLHEALTHDVSYQDQSDGSASLSSSRTSTTTKLRPFKYKLQTTVSRQTLLRKHARQLLSEHASYFSLSTSLAPAREFGYETPWETLLTANNQKKKNDRLVLQLGKGQGQAVQVMHMWRLYYEHIKGVVKAAGSSKGTLGSTYIAPADIYPRIPGSIIVESSIAMLKNDMLFVSLSGRNLNLVHNIDTEVFSRDRSGNCNINRQSNLVVEPPASNFGSNGHASLEYSFQVPTKCMLDIEPRTSVYEQYPEETKRQADHSFLVCRLCSSFGQHNFVISRFSLLSYTWSTHQANYYKHCFAKQPTEYLIWGTFLKMCLSHQVRQRASFQKKDLGEGEMNQALATEDSDLNRMRASILDALKGLVDLQCVLTTYRAFCSQNAKQQSSEDNDDIHCEMQQQYRRCILDALPSLFSSQSRRLKDQAPAYTFEMDSPHIFLPEALIPTLNKLLDDDGKSKGDQVNTPDINGSVKETWEYSKGPIFIEHNERQHCMTSPGSSFPTAISNSFTSMLQQLNTERLHDVTHNNCCAVDPTSTYLFQFFRKSEPLLHSMIQFWSGQCVLPFPSKAKHLIKVLSAAANRNDNRALELKRNSSTNTVLVTLQNDTDRMHVLSRLFLQERCYRSCDIEDLLTYAFSDNNHPGPGCFNYVAGLLGTTDKGQGSLKEFDQVTSLLRQAHIKEESYAFQTLVSWIVFVISIKRPICSLYMDAPTIVVVGPQGAGKTQLVKSLGFDVSPAFGSETNTKGFDGYIFPGTNIMLIDCLALTEALGCDVTINQKHDQNLFKQSYLQAIITSAQLVIVAFNNTRKFSVDIDETGLVTHLVYRNLDLSATPTPLQMVHILRYCIGDVCFLQTKIDQRLAEFVADGNDLQASSDSRHATNVIGQPPDELLQALADLRDIIVQRDQILKEKLRNCHTQARLFSISSFKGSRKLMESARLPNSPTYGLVWDELDLKNLIARFMIYRLRLSPKTVSKALSLQHLLNSFNP